MLARLTSRIKSWLRRTTSKRSAEPAPSAADAELAKLRDMASFAHSLDLEVHAGHGLTFDTTPPVAAFAEVMELVESGALPPLPFTRTPIDEVADAVVRRVAVDRDLAEGGYVQCHACRRPLSAGDLESPDYREGVSCPHCVDEVDEERAARLEERRKQVALAEQRGDKHIGQKLVS